MPYEIRKLKRGQYEVLNSKTGKVHAKHTSLVKAKAQVRLLGMKDAEGGGPKRRRGQSEKGKKLNFDEEVYIKEPFPTHAQLIALYGQIRPLYLTGNFQGLSNRLETFIDDIGGIDHEMMYAWGIADPDGQRLFRSLRDLVDMAPVIQPHYIAPDNIEGLDDAVMEELFNAHGAGYSGGAIHRRGKPVLRITPTYQPDPIREILNLYTDLLTYYYADDMPALNQAFLQWRGEITPEALQQLAINSPEYYDLYNRLSYFWVNAPSLRMRNWDPTALQDIDLEQMRKMYEKDQSDRIVEQNRRDYQDAIIRLPNYRQLEDLYDRVSGQLYSRRQFDEMGDVLNDFEEWHNINRGLMDFWRAEEPDNYNLFLLIRDFIINADEFSPYYIPPETANAQQLQQMIDSFHRTQNELHGVEDNSDLGDFGDLLDEGVDDVIAHAEANRDATGKGFYKMKDGCTLYTGGAELYSAGNVQMIQPINYNSELKNNSWVPSGYSGGSHVMPVNYNAELKSNSWVPNGYSGGGARWKLPTLKKKK